MAEIDDRLAQLQARLDNLVKYQEYFYHEISQLTQEIKQLRDWREKTGPQPQRPPIETKPVVEPTTPQPEVSPPPTVEPPPVRPNPPDSGGPPVVIPTPTPPTEKPGIEKFIGQNLISLVGIVILVLGVAIGGKYAIDKNWITPTMRIVLGYAVGFALVGFALYLKKKYFTFSAVLMSGAMAIVYFITYFAYSLYALYSQTTAFILMVVITAATVYWALNYGKQVIAHIGLVGAYAIPFMVGGDSGQYTFLFSYMALINLGILLISIRKYWKWLFYNAFGFTWLIYFGWYAAKFQTAVHFELALIFLGIFFLMFYLTIIIHKLIYVENFAVENVALILANSFIFYGFGYSILKHHAGYENYLGLFTVANAGIHFVFALAVSRIRLVPRDISYLLATMVLIFTTIAVPVQFQGNWVTLVWTMEAVLLFWIGRKKQIALYEYFSYPVMFLASASMLNDWQASGQRSYEVLTLQTPFLNGVFITSILLAAAFGIIFVVNRDKRYQSAIPEELRKVLGYAIAGMGLFALYNAFRIEISDHFYRQIYQTAVREPETGISLREDEDLELFSLIWQINYTMLFLSVLGWLNIARFKNTGLAIVNLLFNALVMLMFLTTGLFFFSQLRDNYLFQTDAEFFARGSLHIFIRYISYVIAGGLMLVSYRYTKQEFLTKLDREGYLKPLFDLCFYISLWLVLSAELINWMAAGGVENAYKLGLSILWGVYALCLIVIGIFWKNKHLRIGAIALFALTLAKLFFYDIVDLDTISKTIIFVSLGILLLIISFLYNKYKALIFDPDESEKGPQAD